MIRELTVLRLETCVHHPRGLVYAHPVTDADPVEVAAWQMAAGDLRSEDLPEIATEALLRGLDSPALRLLAGQSRADVRDSADLFRTALDELGIDLPDADTANWNLARRTASKIVEGRTEPGRGANALWMVYDRVLDSGDLRIFVGLASELDDRPEDNEQLSEQIMAEAEALLHRPKPRRWIKLLAARGRAPITQTAAHDDFEVDLEALEVSDALRADVSHWNGKFVDVLGGWPDCGGFSSVEEAEAFVADGERLVSRLQRELGPTYNVEYMPEPTRPPGVKLRPRRT